MQHCRMAPCVRHPIIVDIDMLSNRVPCFSCISEQDRIIGSNRLAIHEWSAHTFGACIDLSWERTFVVLSLKFLLALELNAYHLLSSKFII
jgi:hypothetical protein